MPFWHKLWFTVQAALFPMWTAIALGLRISHALFFFALGGVRSNGSFEFVFSKAIGMYAHADVDACNALDDDESAGILPSASPSTFGPPISFPHYLPLAEVHRFICGPTNQVELRLVRKPVTRRKYLTRAISIFLTMAYIVQAATTIVLVFRRTRIQPKVFFSVGIPIALPKSSKTDYLHIPRGSLTLADTQSARVSILGLIMATIFIILQCTNIQWHYKYPRSHWEYNCDFALPRVFIGGATSFVIDQLLVSYQGFDSAFGMYYHLMVVMADRMGLALFSVVMVCQIPVNSFLIVWLNRKEFLLRSGFCNFFCYLTSFSSYDFSNQTATIYHHLGWFMTSSKVRALILPSSQRWLIAYLGVLWAFQIGFQAIRIRFFAQTLTGNGDFNGTLPATSSLGCIYEEKVYPWMWKDPLADAMWAF
ncbi:hypothetical protein B0J11DRAFT_583095 [Dendryphion nanum]|uniref:Uncharacterized protein n=1 Tax=Dendryphion nanum TaxID=256645 RepID=A0A9P9DEJ8_9PLEO|nr:hypothetical protein B0J11DRAFT_583095 [Dendryphion nanum]